MVSVRKKLATGIVIGAWSYDDGTCIGQSIGIKDTEEGSYSALVHVESVNCIDGPINRIVIKKSRLNQLGWTIIEE